jgi:transcription elongation factor GreB
MNKAFTKEGETEETLPEFVDALPPGARNYMTPQGAARLQEELQRLTDMERPQLAANKDSAPAKKRLREVDQRIQYIGQRLQITEVVDQSRRKDCEQVFFGASVTYRDITGAEHTVRIVGVDEARVDAGEVSWVSPLARALNGAWLDEVVKLASPAGVEEIEILNIEYL